MLKIYADYIILMNYTNKNIYRKPTFIYYVIIILGIIKITTEQQTLEFVKLHNLFIFS